jgi:ABC-2 type transport system permease protein
MLGKPLFQLVFFTLLGRFSGVADDRYFIVGNAVQVSAVAGVFGMVMSLANEREFGTLSAILATPANRFLLFFGRTVPLILNGLFITTFMMAAAFFLLHFRMPVAALPAVAGAVLITTVSCALFGLAIASIGLRVRDLWVGSNLAYNLMLLLCGGSLPSSALPAWLAAIGQGLPMTHGIAAVRGLVAGASLHDVAGLIGSEALVGLAYALIAYALLRLFEAESRRRATLDLL